MIKPRTLCGDKIISLYQSLKYAVIICGTNNLDTDNLDKISNGLICITLLFQKNFLQIIVNGLIPHDAIKTKAVGSKPIVARQMYEV